MYSKYIILAEGSGQWAPLPQQPSAGLLGGGSHAGVTVLFGAMTLERLGLARRFTVVSGGAVFAGLRHL